MTAYYNEVDPYAAQWLKNLISAGHIAPGVVDERDIRDVYPSDLDGFTQCHFFAGIGVWSLALRNAGWPDDRHVWTGSCPCQPFSAAGRGSGVSDERHLWPHWHWLISQQKPRRIFGEQVASKDGLGWLDLVQADLEGTGYASAALDLCAAGFGAPHIRQRLYFVAERLADANGVRCSRERGGGQERVAEYREAGRLADADSRQRNWIAEHGQHESDREAGGREQGHSEPTRHRDADRMANADGRDASAERQQRGGQHGQQSQDTSVSDGDRSPNPTNGHWRDVDWLGCRDGKFRPVEPGTFPLAHGATARVGRLRAYGNAIVAPQAQAFIEAYMESTA